MSISPGWVDQAPWGAAAADASQPTSLTKDFAHDDDAESPTQIASLGTQTCSEAPCCYSNAQRFLRRRFQRLVRPESAPPAKSCCRVHTHKISTRPTLVPLPTTIAHHYGTVMITH